MTMANGPRPRPTSHDARPTTHVPRPTSHGPRYTARDPRQTHLSRGEIDHLLGGEITLVSDQQLVDVVARVAVYLLQPLLHVAEALLVGAVVDDDDAVGAAVVGRGDGAEPLLAGRVPDLEFDCFAFQLDGADFLSKREGAVSGGGRGGGNGR